MLVRAQGSPLGMVGPSGLQSDYCNKNRLNIDLLQYTDIETHANL